MRFAVGALLAISFFAGSARGDSPEALVREGLSLRRQQRDVEALAMFRRAYDAAPSARVRAQIALAEQALGRWAASERDLTAALEAAGDPWIDANREPLKRALAFVASQLASVDVACTVAGATVWVNGERAGVTPLDHALRIPAGTALVRVEAPGYVPAERTLHLDAGDRARESVALVAEVASPPAAPPPDASPVVAPPPAATLSPAAPPSAAASPVAPEAPRVSSAVAPETRASRPFSWPTLVAASVGVAGLTVGTIYGLDVFSEKAARNVHCNPGCDGPGFAADSAARSDALISTVAFSVGAAGAATAVWLFFHPPRKAGRALSIAPAVARTSAGVGITGVW